VQIIGIVADQSARDGFDGTERCLRAAGSDRCVANWKLDSIVCLEMRAIRQIVTDIDVGGNPQGRKA
jgi:hypothetical protein